LRGGGYKERDGERKSSAGVVEQAFSCWWREDDHVHRNTHETNPEKSLKNPNPIKNERREQHARCQQRSDDRDGGCRGKEGEFPFLE
jgi:hypothetical protein